MKRLQKPVCIVPQGLESYTSQVIYYFDEIFLSQPFRQIKNRLVSGRLTHTSSKTEKLENIAV
jgi:hypothetical protein